MNKILVHFVDDIPSNLSMVKSVLTKQNSIPQITFDVHTFSSDEIYFQKAQQDRAPDIALLDIAIGDRREAGYEMAMFVREKFPDAVIIMFSAFDDAATILRYIRAGANDFISKDTPNAQLAQMIFTCWQRVLAKRTMTRDSHDALKLKYVTMAGRSMRGVHTELTRLLATAVRSIHVYGESGTGKEIVAQMLRSCLADRVPFIAVNCAAIAPSLLESQLFGHAKGAFTGAGRDQSGYFEAASNGWLFLDEVADLSLQAQGALLRAIEVGEILRVGESKPRKVNVQILSATNKNLDQLVQQGKFRIDLLERLCAHRIVLPPLRQRKEEIGPLCDLFLADIEGSRLEVAKTTLELLKLYDWPTNIRELKNVLIDMTAFACGNILMPSAIPQKIIDALVYKSDLASEADSKSSSESGDAISLSFKRLPRPLKMLEDELFLAYIEFLIEQRTVGSIRALSTVMGMAHSTLIRRLARLMKKRSSLDISLNVRKFWEKSHAQPK